MKTALDSSFILEILLRRHNSEKCAEILGKIKGNIGISIITVHHAYHFGKKAGIEFEKITRLLLDFHVFVSSVTDHSIALEIHRGSDFEDALQVACALNNSCDQFVTLDQKLCNRYRGLLKMITL